MIDIFKSIGLQRLREDPDLYARLKRHMSDNYKCVAPGYAVDYYEYIFPKYVEFKVAKYLNGQGEDTIMHFTSNDLMTLVFDSALYENDGAHMFKMHVEGGSDSIPIRFVRSDLLADPCPGDRINCQVVAFAGNALHMYDQRDKEEKPILINTAGDLVITGEITKVEARYFDFEDLHSDIHKICINTALGRISLLCTKQTLPEPKIGQMIATDCVVSADPIFKPPFLRWRGALTTPDIPSYGNILNDYPIKIVGGFIPSFENSIRVFIRCAREGTYNRFERCCLPEIVLSTDGNELACRREEVPKRLNELLQSEELESKILHVFKAPGHSSSGRIGLLLHSAKKERAIIRLEPDSSGFIKRIMMMDPTTCELINDPLRNALIGVCECMKDPCLGFLGCKISEGCRYYYESNDYVSTGVKRIIQHFKNSSAERKGSSFKYVLIPSASILRDNVSHPSACNGEWCALIHESGRIHFLFAELDAENLICNMLLTDDAQYLSYFSRSIVQAQKQINLFELIDPFSSSTQMFAPHKNDTIDQSRARSIWREADHFVKRKLNILNWHIDETQVAKDHIRYLGSEDNSAFSLYLFACSEQDDMLLNREHFLHLASSTENMGRRVSFLYTRIIEEESPLESLLKGDSELKNRKVFRARSIDDSTKEPDLWTVEHVDNHDLLIKEPNPWILERTDRRYSLVPYDVRSESILIDRLIAAFNSGDYDLIRSLLSRKCRDTLPLEAFNHIRDIQDFFKALSELYGKLKPAFIRFDRYTFSKVACWESGLYLMPIASNGFQFDQLVFQPLDERYQELIIIDETPSTHEDNEYPRLVSFRCIPRYWNRFLLELSFENGEIKEYSLPTYGIGDEVAMVDGFCFTDRIFLYGRITDSSPYTTERLYLDHFDHGQRIVFPNGYSISTPELYFGSRSKD